jgi:hypothetical protein
MSIWKVIYSSLYNRKSRFSTNKIDYMCLPLWRKSINEQKIQIVIKNASDF